jgi:hypothetical protein
VSGADYLVPQQATFAPVGVARALRFGFMNWLLDRLPTGS